MFKKIITLTLLSSAYIAASVNCQQEYCAVSKNMTFWGFNLYHFDYKKEQNGNEKICLTYKREIEKQKNIDKTIEKFEQNNLNAKDYMELLSIWNSHLIDVKEGTVYEVHVNDKGTTMIIDDNILFNTPSIEFGQMYLKIWAGENSVDEELQKEILLAREKINSRTCTKK